MTLPRSLHTRLNGLDRAEAVLQALRESTDQLRPLVRDAHEAIGEMRRLRSDIVKLIEAANEVVTDERPNIKEQLRQLALDELAVLHTEVEEGIKIVMEGLDKRYKAIYDMIGAEDEPDSLYATLQRHTILKSLRGEPVTAAAEPLKKGDVLVHQGREYVLGAPATKIGTFLYLSKRDGKLYPAAEM